MSELLARLEAATDADREIDARLDHAVHRRGLYWGRGDDFGYTPPANVDNWRDERWREAASELSSTTPAYTKSLDAALSLQEFLLPGWGFVIRRDDDGCNAYLLYPDAMRVTPGGGDQRPNPAIAFCIAVLKAMQTQAAPASATDMLGKDSAQ